MAEIIELEQDQLLPSDVYYEMYGPPFQGDPLDAIMFSFKSKYGHYPDKIFVANGQKYFAEHRGKPKRKDKQIE